MRYTILLNRNENKQEIEAQEQSRFVKTILEALEIPVLLNPDEPLSIIDKIKLRKSLETYNISIISDFNDGMKVFANNELIGEWYKISYKLKKDDKQLNLDKKVYLEATMSFWTAFEKDSE